MFYVNLEKKSPLSGAWSERRCVFDTERRYFYYSDRIRLFDVKWKHAMKVHRLRAECMERPFDLSTLHGADARNLYTIHVEGALRDVNTLLQQEGDGGPQQPRKPEPRVGPMGEETLLFRRPARGRPSLNSPKKSRAALSQSLMPSHSEKLAEWTFRCECLVSFYKVVDVFTDVLADCGLCPPLQGGLPLSDGSQESVIASAAPSFSLSSEAVLLPQFTAVDYRNGLPLSRVPPHLLFSLKSLDRTVNYCLERGDLVGTNLNGQLGAVLPGCYLSITDEMVLVLRDNASVPRWIALQSIAEVHYSSAAAVPFVALLTADPSPDVVFMPSPPTHGPAEIAAYSAAAVIDRILRILKVVVCGSRNGSGVTGDVAPLSNAAVGPCAAPFVDVNEYRVVSQYIIAKSAARPFKWTPVPGFSQPLICPLPREHLAAMLASEELTKRASCAHMKCPSTCAVTAPWVVRAAKTAKSERALVTSEMEASPNQLRRLNQTPVVFGRSRNKLGGQKATAGTILGTSPFVKLPAAMGTSASMMEFLNDSATRESLSRVRACSLGASVDIDLALSVAASAVVDQSMGSRGVAEPHHTVVDSVPTTKRSTEFDDDLEDLVMEEGNLDDIVLESFASGQSDSALGDHLES